jgi:hypothetical protein
VSSTEQDFQAQEDAQYGVWFPPPFREPFNASSPGLAASIVARVGNCRLYGFTVTSTNVAAQFIQVYDLGAVPANGVRPRYTLNVPAGATVGAYYGSVGRWMDQGIVIVNSTTQGTLTIGAADCLFDVQYV